MRENDLKWNKPWIMQRADPYVYRDTTPLPRMREEGRCFLLNKVPANLRVLSLVA